MENWDQKKYEKALNLALYYLSLKARSESELRGKLMDKEIEQLYIDSVIEEAIKRKWIDDLFYAKTYIESTKARYGRYRVKQYLKRKGIDDLTIGKAYDELEDEAVLEDEFNRVRDVLEKKISAITIDWALIENDYHYKMKIYRKLCQFLLTRGFSGDCVNQVVRERLTKEFFDEL